jgi:hypothetical protein
MVAMWGRDAVAVRGGGTTDASGSKGSLKRIGRAYGLAYGRP